MIGQILLSKAMSHIPEISSLSEELMQSARTMEIEEYYGSPAGPEVKSADSVILCEGRADVLNLLKQGIKNAIAIGGTSIAKEIPELCKKKEVTVFVDGDRGGDIIIKELKQIADIDFITKAPEGKEVEELTKKEIFKSLRDKVPLSSYVEHENRNSPVEKNGKKEVKTFFGFMKKKTTSRPNKDFRPLTTTQKNKINDNSKKFLKEQLDKIIGTKAAAIFEENNIFAGRVPIKELSNIISKLENPHTLVIDGELDMELLKKAEQCTIKYIACTEKTNLISSKIVIFSL